MLFEAAKFLSRACDAFARRIDIGLYLDSSMVAEIYKANGIQASQSRTLHGSPVVACNQSTCGVLWRFCLMLSAQVQQQDDGLDEEIEGD